MTVRIITGDCRLVLPTLPDESVQTCITSPPYYGLRDYREQDQMGLEETPEAYIAGMVAVFREVRRVLRKDGTLWLNIGDSYAGSWGSQCRQGHTDMASRSAVSARSIAAGKRRETRAGSVTHLQGIKAKDLFGIPWMLAFALRADGWFLRCDIIWHKLNPTPESVKDRPTKAHEYLFLLAKSRYYYYDECAISEPVSGGAHPGGRGPESRIKPSKTGVGWGYDTRKPRVVADPAQASGRRNRRSVWSTTSEPYKGAHYATFPPKLIEPCILAGSTRGGLVLDPFGGHGTTGLVAERHGRNSILIELGAKDAAAAARRIRAEAPLLTNVVME